MITWIKNDGNADIFDWVMAIQFNNPTCVDTLCLIDDNNPQG